MCVSCWHWIKTVCSSLLVYSTSSRLSTCYMYNSVFRWNAKYDTHQLLGFSYRGVTRFQSRKSCWFFYQPVSGCCSNFTTSSWCDWHATLCESCLWKSVQMQVMLLRRVKQVHIKYIIKHCRYHLVPTSKLSHQVSWFFMISSNQTYTSMSLQEVQFRT